MYFSVKISKGGKSVIDIPPNDILSLCYASMQVANNDHEELGVTLVMIKPSNSWHNSLENGFIAGRLEGEDFPKHAVLNLNFTSKDGPVEIWTTGTDFTLVGSTTGQDLKISLENSTKLSTAKYIQSTSIDVSSAIDVAANQDAIEDIDNSKTNERKETGKSKKKRKRDAGSANEASEVSAISKPPTIVNMKKVWNVKPQNEEGVLVPANKVKVIHKPMGLKYTDFVIGSGPQPVPGATVKIVYTGILSDGTVFDEKLKRTQPLVFRKGVNQVVKGLDLGIESMRIGGSREIHIPPALGYGKDGWGSVPGGEHLVFRVTLVG
mmetsp:Transcript_32785/g.55275  ORF Transcript_32785/g.55275 Transcript_32785/m.55275 type:complete len:322 (+) Transcript_32785:77-1042(+)